jgi:glutamate-ammonia-ligase adenylyltransferase
LQLEKGAAPHNLKRGPGGTLDIEFVAQFLQLENASEDSRVLTANTQDALSALIAAGVVPSELGQALGDSYRFLRRVESALRLLNTSARHDFPADAEPLGQLALLLRHSNPSRLREECLARMSENRAAFDGLFPP